MKCGTRFTTGWWSWSEQHRSTLVFVNTRRLAERIAHHLGERLGEDNVAAHHGSLSRKLRLAAETETERRRVKVLVATASLELGIDIGTVDLVVQISSPRAIAVALQRVGRSGHWRGAIPKGRFFAGTRDDLLECAALVRAIRQGDLDRLIIPDSPLDILAQQIVATCAAESSTLVWRGVRPRMPEACQSRGFKRTLATTPVAEHDDCRTRDAGGAPAPHSRSPMMMADGMKMNSSPWSSAPIPIAIFRARLTTRFSKCFPRALPRGADAMALTSITTA